METRVNELFKKAGPNARRWFWTYYKRAKAAGLPSDEALQCAKVGIARHGVGLRFVVEPDYQAHKDYESDVRKGWANREPVAFYSVGLYAPADDVVDVYVDEDQEEDWTETDPDDYYDCLASVGGYAIPEDADPDDPKENWGLRDIARRVSLEDCLRATFHMRD